MQISLRWLRDYIDVELSPEALADKLTMVGLEVDSINEISPGFSDVVVAKILSIKPHPNSEKLSLCQVTTGSETLPVVCGARNIQAGNIVPLAKVGATIPGGYTIKSSRLRGELSEGMLCSEEELGIGEDMTGIMILPGHLDLGMDLSAALNLKDTVFDIGVTPNRSDCLSIIGIAREIAAITGKKVRYPSIKFSEEGEDINNLTSVEILNSDLCPRYTARMIKNVRVEPSPSWIRLRLESVGLRAINNVVDVTNFVMMELGQPLHAFDFRHLEEGRIIVRGSLKGEEFISLDEKSRMLDANTLMICDGVKPVAIAGIMGGLNSEVVDDTETVFLESAYFDPPTIRRASRKLGMGTDAAFRFERGVDSGGIVRALNRAAQLIADLSGGSICRNYIDQYPKKIETAKNIPLRVHKVNETLGTKIEAEEVRSVLEGLEMKVQHAEDIDYLVTPPSFRVDISREIDLIEEVARIHGYDDVPLSLPAVPAGSGRRDRKNILKDKVRHILNGYGYSEIINYSFTTPQSADILGIKTDDKGRKFVKIRSPLTEDMSVMRTGLVYGFLETMRKNINAGNFNLKMFEMGKVFISQEGKELPDEEEKVGALITGSRYDDLWHFKGLLSDFYDLKGCVENLLNAIGICDLRFKSDIDLAFLHPGRSCRVMAGERDIGFLGEIHPEVLEKMGLTQIPIVFELDLLMLADLFSEKMLYKEIPRVPSISRDVAFVIDKKMESEKILSLVLRKEEKLLEDVKIFDVYCGKGIPEGEKSLAVRFTYRSSDRTLTDDEISEVHSRIIKEIVDSTGAKIRGVKI
ncbi:MAG: phenylalanine--tRNA ligase subunit beta [Desulfobacteraceae bacterium 4484_190.3]|nr:MAG: phenylalanine--tRNA ligase subunit beta [Desulfobacteraceae bacterium 4484_190.3]